MAELGEKGPAEGYGNLGPGGNTFRFQHPQQQNQQPPPGTKPTYRLPSGMPIVRVNLANAQVPGQTQLPRPLFQSQADYWNGGTFGFFVFKFI